MVCMRVGEQERERVRAGEKERGTACIQAKAPPFHADVTFQGTVYQMVDTDTGYTASNTGQWCQQHAYQNTPYCTSGS